MNCSSSKTARESLPGEITLLLSDWNNPDSLQTLMRLVYDELHQIASGLLRREPSGRSILPSDLISQTCVRLLESKTVYQNHRHFFGSVAKAMRRILIESARRRNTRKRDSGCRRVAFAEAERFGFERPDELLEFDFALSRLAKINPSWLEVTELRVFGGWTTFEIAAILGCGQSTARRRWKFAREWLANELRANR